jgi:hypothetical protein
MDDDKEANGNEPRQTRLAMRKITRKVTPVLKDLQISRVRPVNTL